jgi:hypothetical protein
VWVVRAVAGLFLRRKVRGARGARTWVFRVVGRLFYNGWWWGKKCSEQFCEDVQLLGRRAFINTARRLFVDNRGAKYFFSAQVLMLKAELAVDKKELRNGDCQGLHRMLKHCHSVGHSKTRGKKKSAGRPKKERVDPDRGKYAHAGHLTPGRTRRFSTDGRAAGSEGKNPTSSEATEGFGR